MAIERKPKREIPLIVPLAGLLIGVPVIVTVALMIFPACDNYEKTLDSTSHLC
jgi:hypothetical protein